MNDKHMDEVMRELDKECDECLKGNNNLNCLLCKSLKLPTACRSYARKVCEAVKAIDFTPDPRDETKDNFVAHACRILHELDKQIDRLTDKEPKP